MQRTSDNNSGIQSRNQPPTIEWASSFESLKKNPVSILSFCWTFKKRNISTPINNFWLKWSQYWQNLYPILSSYPERWFCFQVWWNRFPPVWREPKRRSESRPWQRRWLERRRVQMRRRSTSSSSASACSTSRQSTMFGWFESGI